MIRFVALVALCSGCFVQAGMSYAPGSTITVQRMSDPSPVVHTGATASINFRLGVFFDLAGVGVHYGWYAARVIRHADGLPRQPNASGNYTRLDVDLPVRFGPLKLFLLRGSYAYESFDSFHPASNTSLATTGHGHPGGLTIATLAKDISLSALVGKYQFETTGDSMPGGWPAMSLSTWDLDVGLTINFIPTGTLISTYKYEQSPVQGPSVCGWQLAKDGGGFVCR